jgi:hypothetical protein
MTFQFESLEERQVAKELGFVVRRSTAARGVGNESDRISLEFFGVYGDDKLIKERVEVVSLTPDTSYALRLFEFAVRQQRDLNSTLARLTALTEQREARRSEALAAVKEAASAP